MPAVEPLSKLKVSPAVDARTLGQGMVIFDTWSGDTHFVDSANASVFGVLPREWLLEAEVRQGLLAASHNLDVVLSPAKAEAFMNEMLEAGILLSQ